MLLIAYGLKRGCSCAHRGRYANQNRRNESDRCCAQKHGKCVNLINRLKTDISEKLQCRQESPSNNYKYDTSYAINIY